MRISIFAFFSSLAMFAFGIIYRCKYDPGSFTTGILTMVALSSATIISLVFFLTFPQKEEEVITGKVGDIYCLEKKRKYDLYFYERSITGVILISGSLQEGLFAIEFPGEPPYPELPDETNAISIEFLNDIPVLSCFNDNGSPLGKVTLI